AVALLWLALCLLASACNKVSPAPDQAESESEQSFARQAAAVREGRSEQIRLDEQSVSDDDLAHLAGLEDKLLRLNLSHTTITDAGLAQIARMRHLEQLRLAS